jgi:nitrilase
VLVVFPEAFLPAWLAWVDEVLPGEDEAWHLRLLAQSVVVPGPATEQLGAAARDAGVHLVMGVNEREAHGGTIYNTVLHFDADGRLLGRHRKRPTGSGCGGGPSRTVTGCWTATR